MLNTTDLYTLIAQNAMEGIVLEDERGCFSFVNPAAAHLLGYDRPDELVGLHWRAITPPDLWPVVEAANERRARGEAGRYEVILLRRDGSRIPVLISGSPLLTDEGHVFEGTVAFFIDITELKAVQEADRTERILAEALRDTAAILSSAITFDDVLAEILALVGRVVPHAAANLALLDDQGAVVRVVRAHGYGTPERDAAMLQMALPVQSVPSYRYMMEKGQPCIIPDVRGDERWVALPETSWIASYAAAPIRVKGRVAGFLNLESETPGFFGLQHSRPLLAFADQAAMAVENARLFAEAQQRAGELELANRQAQEAQLAAEAANRAKSVFLANMSHELRTPLNAILGFSAQLSHDASLNTRQREDLAIINHSGEHLLHLINDVLDMAKIESGRMVLQPAAFDLHRMLDEVGEMFRARAAGRDLDLEVVYGDDIPLYVWADEAKLRQVLINLLGNAVKFTAEGHVGLYVEANAGRAAARSPALVELCFEVRDTGPGIPPHELEAIFEPFVQAGSDKSQDGTGLGLAISRQYARLMGGDLVAASEGISGRGTSFRLSVPFQVAGPEDVPEVRRRLRPRAIRLAPDQPTYRLLVVDDSEPSRLLLVRILSGLGFAVESAANGLEGLRIWESWRPHLIWMDMRMPVMDGHEATQRIKSTTQGQATTVIALTASVFEDQRVLVLSEGCDDFVRKPVRLEDIEDRLVKYLGVHFLYEEVLPPVPEIQLSDAAPVVATLAPAWRSALYQAAMRADQERVLALIEEIRPQHSALADTLAGHVDNFDYDALLACCAAPDLTRNDHELP